jgi:hypothetical protein
MAPSQPTARQLDGATAGTSRAASSQPNPAPRDRSVAEEQVGDEDDEQGQDVAGEQGFDAAEEQGRDEVEQHEDEWNWPVNVEQWPPRDDSISPRKFPLLNQYFKFNRGRGDKYDARCVKCGLVIYTSKPDREINHIVKKCPEIDEEERSLIAEQATDAGFIAKGPGHDIKQVIDSIVVDMNQLEEQSEKLDALIQATSELDTNSVASHSRRSSRRLNRLVSLQPRHGALSYTVVPSVLDTEA